MARGTKATEAWRFASAARGPRGPARPKAAVNERSDARVRVRRDGLIGPCLRPGGRRRKRTAAHPGYHRKCEGGAPTSAPPCTSKISPALGNEGRGVLPANG